MKTIFWDFFFKINAVLKKYLTTKHKNLKNSKNKEKTQLGIFGNCGFSLIVLFFINFFMLELFSQNYYL